MRSRLGTEYQNSIAKFGTIGGTTSQYLSIVEKMLADMYDQLGISQVTLPKPRIARFSANRRYRGGTGCCRSAASWPRQDLTDTIRQTGGLRCNRFEFFLGIMAGSRTCRHISDSLITTQNLGVTTVAERASNMGRAIATASGFGVSMENLEAAYISTTKAVSVQLESTTFLQVDQELERMVLRSAIS